MKAILRWIAGVIGTIIALAATIVLLPYAGDIVNKIMPDVTSAAERTAGVISSKLSESARLESITVTESGTVNHDLSLAGISVGGVTFDYDYTASFGIDLKRVQMVVSGSKIVFMLPQPELILDDLVPRNISRKDTLVIISDEDYEALLERERLACRARYLSGDRQQELWDATVRVMQSTVEVWLTNVDDRLSFEYALLDESSGS
ncbi:MAG: hypothetical protein E7327_03250 [Clostridiales bacterium]|nr:hypothetical protein [Clostridiales bacterium]